MNSIVKQIIYGLIKGKKYNKYMQEKLKNNDILMHSTHNESNSVITERFIKILKFKIYKRMTANDSKSYLYLKKLVNENNNTYYHSINEKTINAYYSALTEDIESNPKAPKFKVNDRVGINKYKNVLSKSYTGNWSRKTFIIGSVFKTNPWNYKIKDLNGKKII